MPPEPSAVPLLPDLFRRRPGGARALARAGTAVASPAWWRGLRRLGELLAPGLLPLLLLFLWDLAVRRAWVSELILPAPAVVWESFRGLWEDGTIFGHIAVSSGRVAKGFLIGSSIGLVLGTLLGLSARARAYLQPTLLGVYQVNILAWIPFFILLIGIDEGLKVLVVAWATVLPVTINTMKGISSIPARWLELARVYHLGRTEVVWRVAAPAALPSLFTGLRSGLADAWMSLVLVELIASSEGVGYMVVWGRQLFQLDLVAVAIVIIGVIGLTLDLALRLLEQKLKAWHFEAA